MGDETEDTAEPALIDVGGYRLAARVAGQGAPAVVLEMGLGAEAHGYDAIAQQVAHETRVVWYDHAGIGQSAAAPARVRTVADLARDLRALLTAARIPPPYVLAGHSLGGLTVRYFRHCFPGDVAALVLLDSAHEEQRERLLAALPPAAPVEYPAITQARHGLTVTWNVPSANPEGIDNVANSALLRACGPLGDLPLVVLSRGRPPTLPEGYPAELAARREQVWQQMQRELAALSTSSVHLRAKRSGHMVNQDEPEAVVSAIQQAVALAREQMARAGR